MNSRNGRIYRVADVEVDVLRGCLRRGGEERHLRQQTCQVLLYLIEHRERGVTKEELIGSVWRGAAVTDDALVQCVAEIRRALGDDPRRPRFIKTIPKIGYSLVAPVEEVNGRGGVHVVEHEEVTSVQIEYEEDEAEPAPPARVAHAATPALPPRPSSHKKIALAGALALVLLAAGAAFLRGRWRAPQPEEQHATTTLPRVEGKRSLAVMYFENLSGDADLNWLREGLADMLVTNLSRSQKLLALSRQQLHLLLERGGHAPGGNVTLERALEVARKSRADTVVMGSFARLGGKMRIDVRLHDAASGQLVAAESLTAEGLEAVLPQVDLLSLKLAARMGVEPDRQEPGGGLGGVITTSLDAYRYYSLALEQGQMHQLSEAVGLLEKSLALDPQFAMAHARVGYVYAVKWAQYEKARPHLEKAFRLSDRLTEKDRLYVAAWDAVARHDAARAVQSYREIVARYPLEAEAYQSLGQLLFNLDRGEEAVAAIEQGLVVDPEAAEFYNTLGRVYLRLGRHDEALVAYNHYVRLAPRDPNAYDSLGLFHHWLGRYDEAERAYERALALNPESAVAIIHLGNLHFHRGRYEAAVAQYRRYAQLARDDLARARGHDYVAAVYLQKGDTKRAAEAAGRLTGVPQDWALFDALRLAFARQDAAGVEGIKRRLLTVMSREEREVSGYLRWHYYMLGHVALREGRAEEAVQHFQAALRHQPLNWHYDSYESCLADAYLELGRLDEAVSEYQRVLRLNPHYPLAHYRLAQAYERRGQTAEARAHYERFLRVWDDADADIPQVVAAKSRLAART